MIGKQQPAARVDRMHQGVLLILALTGVAGVWVLDLYTPQDVAIFLLNLIPVFFAPWYVGRRWAFVLAGISSIAWIFDEEIFERSAASPLFSHLNDFIKANLFFACAWISSELQSSLRAVAERNQKLSEANNFLSAFVAMASHDLRTPLTTILFSAEMLHEKATFDGNRDPAEDAELLERIVGAGGRMRLMLENYLDIGRIESGALQLTPRRTDLHSWLHKACDSMQPLAAHVNVRIDCSAPQAPEFYDFDPDLLYVALQNLLTNALKFSPDGSIVEVQAVHEEDGFILRVRDHGPGVGNNPDQLFEMFRSGSQQAHHPQKSTGLGLYIVRRVIDAHGGTARAYNNADDGATFELLVPRYCTAPSVGVSSS